MNELVEFVTLVSGGGIAAVAFARRRRVVRAPKLPSSYAMHRLIRKLPARHRREAQRIVAIAREHDKRHVAHRVDAFTARETLRSYLPETVHAYLAVPIALRTQPRNGQPSPDEECAHQLYMLRAGLEKLRDGDAEIAAQRMRENKTFLHDRFGTPPPPIGTRRPLPPFLELLNDKLAAFLRGA